MNLKKQFNPNEHNENGQPIYGMMQIKFWVGCEGTIYPEMGYCSFKAEQSFNKETMQLYMLSGALMAITQEIDKIQNQMGMDLDKIIYPKDDETLQ